MGHRALKGAVCYRPSILGRFRIENNINYYHRLKSEVFNSDIKKLSKVSLPLQQAEGYQTKI